MSKERSDAVKSPLDRMVIFLLDILFPRLDSIVEARRSYMDARGDYQRHPTGKGKSIMEFRAGEFNRLKYFWMKRI